ncbi:hypothetical protein U1Q18_023339, partial [Sarracenia purpurea var. burkii]
MASRGRGKNHGCGLRRAGIPIGGASGGRAFSRLHRVPAGGDGGADAGLASGPVTTTVGRAQSATDALA